MQYTTALLPLLTMIPASTAMSIDLYKDSSDCSTDAHTLRLQTGPGCFNLGSASIIKSTQISAEELGDYKITVWGDSECKGSKADYDDAGCMSIKDDSGEYVNIYSYEVRE